MRVLVVEDEHRIANSIQKGLNQERFAVDVAYTGTDGLDMAMGEDYDLVILDLMLPGISGEEICKQLRANGKQTPILILTAKGNVYDKVKGLDAGADDYLTKPFSFEELLARIRAISRRPKDSLGNTLKIGNLELDTQSYRVCRGSREIMLTNKEYGLLEYMMRNPGKILSKDQIISHVWNYEANILPNTVEVYVKNLREKIDLTNQDDLPLIKTVRGFGYKIEA